MCLTCVEALASAMHFRIFKRSCCTMLAHVRASEFPPSAAGCPTAVRIRAGLRMKGVVCPSLARCLHTHPHLPRQPWDCFEMVSAANMGFINGGAQIKLHSESWEEASMMMRSSLSLFQGCCRWHPANKPPNADSVEDASGKSLKEARSWWL